MEYTTEELLALIARHDRHEDYYRGLLRLPDPPPLKIRPPEPPRSVEQICNGINLSHALGDTGAVLPPAAQFARDYRWDQYVQLLWGGPWRGRDYREHFGRKWARAHSPECVRAVVTAFGLSENVALSAQKRLMW